MKTALRLRKLPDGKYLVFFDCGPRSLVLEGPGENVHPTYFAIARPENVHVEPQTGVDLVERADAEAEFERLRRNYLDAMAAKDVEHGEKMAAAEKERGEAIEMVKRNAHHEGFNAGRAFDAGLIEEKDKRAKNDAHLIDQLKAEIQRLHNRAASSCPGCYEAGVKEGRAQMETAFQERARKDIEDARKLRELGQAAVNEECERANKAERRAELAEKAQADAGARIEEMNRLKDGDLAEIMSLRDRVRYLESTYRAPGMARIQGKKEGREEVRVECDKLEEALKHDRATYEATLSKLITEHKAEIMQKDLVIAALRGMTTVDIVTECLPGPKSEFVEAEINGRSVNVGDWYLRPDGLFALKINLAKGAAEKMMKNYDGGYAAGLRAGRREEQFKEAGFIPRPCPKCTEMALVLMREWGVKIEDGRVIGGPTARLSEEDDAALEMGRVLLERRKLHFHRHKLDEAYRERHQAAFWRLDKIARQMASKSEPATPFFVTAGLGGVDAKAGAGGHVPPMQPGRGGASGTCSSPTCPCQRKGR